MCFRGSWRWSKLLFVFGTTVLLTGCGTITSEIVVEDAWIRPAQASRPAAASTSPLATEEAAPGSDSVTAAYMTLKNMGKAADRLTDVNSPLVTAIEIHRIVVENDVLRMEPISGLEIPADSSFRLQPGGHHLMLIGLHQDIIVGQTVELILTFESGKIITVRAQVQEQMP
jgi:hypothetical protein